MSQVQIVRSFIEELSKNSRKHPDRISVDKINGSALSTAIGLPETPFPKEEFKNEEKKVHIIAKTVRPPVISASAEVSTSSTILELKESLAPQLNVAVTSLRLLHKGKPLVNSKFLADYFDPEATEVSLQMFLLQSS
ncbi:ubiquitin family protein, Get5 candidate [Schizosaccharomyces osmophilus]|uniref:Ubiquitin family protein, Get5 candidate n=1 Tax=Schizosaccharomyces osmophilus TaxID=2545709 RepID=A0AAE9W7G7_9SCHI|nr:ubiquitin family protein, Get5 candidate [Schizosaccharomyces osmophilus]WBW70840.1 ubiquitin family protein, Get5 candidate [Schizosaccharomyces osmophilus]